MSVLQWIRARLSQPNKKGELVYLVQEGQAQLTLEQYEKARTAFFRVRELVLESGSRDKPEASVFLQYVLRMLETTWLMTEQLDEQITFFSEHINRYATDPAAYCGRASALWYSGQLQKAIDDYSRAIDLMPANVLALSSRGQIRAELGDHEGALKDLEQALQALKTTPHDSRSDATDREWWKQIEAFVHRGNADALAGIGKSTEARDELSLSMSLCPENAWAYYSRAQLFEATGDHKKAIEDYQTALTKRGPALNLIRRQSAQARLRDLLGDA